jgi:hypothetical protein
MDTQSPGNPESPSAPNADNFDFDAWQRLAKDSPQDFFARREEAIEACIASHPHAEGREQMRRLQEQIDGLRLMAGGPDRALQGIATMLSDHLNALTAHLSSLGEETQRLSGLLKKIEMQGGAA